MHDEALQMLNRTAYEQFVFWWSSCFPRCLPGEVVSAMWRDFPFGALTTQSDWAWWSLSDVASDGVRLARDLQCAGGMVIAQSNAGMAVLSWPRGPGTQAVVLMVAFGGARAKPPATSVTVDPQRFLNAKGFSDPDHVIACAVPCHNSLKQPLVTAMGGPVSFEAPPANRRASEQACLSASTRKASARQP